MKSSCHAHIQLHHGKTQVWNRGGLEPAGIGALTRAPRAVKPDAVVWRGDPLLPVHKQGLKVLGIPIGQPAFVADFLDRFGHHRAACAVAGVLGRRGYPLECAAAQVCREAGARVSTNVHVRDLDLADLNAVDGRRLEVVADGLSLWHGAQLATDTTLVLCTAGGLQILEVAKRQKERTGPVGFFGNRSGRTLERRNCHLPRSPGQGAC